jgi:hypothetical protein
MTHKQLLATLASGKVAAVPRQNRPALARNFVESESHSTGIAGLLRIGRIGDKLVAVEEADAGLIAVRPLASAKAAASFVQQRLAAYDRLWDG